MRKAALGAAALTATVAAFWRIRVASGGALAWLDGDWEYYGIGAQLARYGLYRPFPGLGPTAFRMPLYPTFVALCFHASPGLRSLALAQCVLDAGSTLAAAALAAGLSGPVAGILAGILYASHPGLVAHAGDPSLEPLFGLCVLAVALALARWAREPGRVSLAILAGVSIGLSLTCRSTLVFLAPVYLTWRWVRRRPVPVMQAATFVLCAALALVPWILRNAAVFGSLIPFENGPAAGTAWEASIGLDAPIQDVGAASLAPEDASVFAQAHAEVESARAAVLWRAAVENVFRRPLRFSVGFLRRAWALWAGQWPLLALAAGGFVLGAFRGDDAQVVILLAGYFTIQALFVTEPRYIRPALGPLCALAAAGGLFLVRRRLCESEPKALILPSRACLGILAAIWLAACVWLARESRRWSAVPAPPVGFARAKVLNDEGVSLALQGRLDEARSRFDAALALCPDFGESLVSRVMVEQTLGQDVLAQRDADAALAVLETGQLSGSPPSMR